MKETRKFLPREHPLSRKASVSQTPASTGRPLSLSWKTLLPLFVVDERARRARMDMRMGMASQNELTAGGV